MSYITEEYKKKLKENFNFSDTEVDEIEEFFNENNNKTAGEILDTIEKENTLGKKQIIILSYIVGASVGTHVALR